MAPRTRPRTAPWSPAGRRPPPRQRAARRGPPPPRAPLRPPAAATTGGVATVPVTASSTLRAVGPGAAPAEIPSNELPVCVSATLGDCPAEPGRRIVGTNAHDGFKGGAGPDQIRTRGGKDK